eukprot:1223934-Pleurochrysis_carterae.AAC.1
MPTLPPSKSRPLRQSTSTLQEEQPISPEPVGSREKLWSSTPPPLSCDSSERASSNETRPLQSSTCTPRRARARLSTLARHWLQLQRRRGGRRQHLYRAFMAL